MWSWGSPFKTLFTEQATEQNISALEYIFQFVSVWIDFVCLGGFQAELFELTISHGLVKTRDYHASLVSLFALHSSMSHDRKNVSWQSVITPINNAYVIMDCDFHIAMAA